MSLFTEIASIHKYKHVSDAEDPAEGSVRQASDNFDKYGQAFHKFNFIALFSFFPCICLLLVFTLPTLFFHITVHMLYVQELVFGHHLNSAYISLEKATQSSHSQNYENDSSAGFGKVSACWVNVFL